jgi:hypothetical protein
METKMLDPENRAISSCRTQTVRIVFSCTSGKQLGVVIDDRITDQPITFGIWIQRRCSMAYGSASHYTFCAFLRLTVP